MKFRPRPLDQQTLVITGASSGIGLATARQAVAEGAKVVLVARNEDALKTICDELRERGGRVAYAVADVGVKAEVDGVVQTALREFGGFDTWVNDAGVGIYATSWTFRSTNTSACSRPTTGAWSSVRERRFSISAPQAAEP